MPGTRFEKTAQELALAVEDIIAKHGSRSPKVKVPFAAYLSALSGEPVSNTKANQTLTWLVEEKVLARVTLGKHMYYTANLPRVIETITGDL